MKLMIVEPEASGHRMVLYTRSLIGECVRRDWDITLLTTDHATRHSAFRIVEAESGGRFKLHLMPHAARVRRPATGVPTTAALLRQQARQFRAVSAGYARATAEVQPDLVYMVTLDYLDKVMAVVGSPFGGTAFAGMMLNPGFHRRRVGLVGPGTRSDRLYEWCFKRVLSTPQLRAITVIDPLFQDYARSLPDRHRSLIHYVPDAAATHPSGEGRRTARRSLGLRPEDIVVLLYGSITPRKGLRTLLDALSHPDVPDNVVALIAGQQDEAAKRMLHEPGAVGMRSTGRLVEVNEFLDDQGEYRVLLAADVAWLNYDRFYAPSGFLIQAGAAGVPIVACREGVVGWLTDQHGLGEIVPSGSPAAAAHALTRLANDSALRERLGRNGRDLAAKHTPQDFANSVCDVIGASIESLGSCA